MEIYKNNNEIRKQIFYWFGILVVLVTGVMAFNNYVNMPVQALEERVREMEKNRVTKEDFYRLEAKIDKILLSR